MKLRKAVTIFLTLALTVALAVPAFAYDLGPFSQGGPDSHNYWFTDGTDDGSYPLTEEILRSATGIRVEFSEIPEGGTVQLVYFGAGNSWGWTQHDLEITSTVLEIPFAAFDGFEEAFSEDGGTKIALGFWEGDLSDYIVSATLVGIGGGSAGGGVGGGGEAAATGDSTLIYVAVVALIVAVAAFVIIRKKAKV